MLPIITVSQSEITTTINYNISDKVVLNGRVKFYEENNFSIEKHEDLKLCAFFQCALDFNGNITTKTDYLLKEDFFETVVTEYDTAKNQIREAEYFLDGEFWWRTTFLYDSERNITEKVYYNLDNSINYKAVFQYDSKGNMVEETSYGPDNNLQDKTIYKYDFKGNITVIYNCTLDMKYIFEYVFDNKDNYIKVTKYRVQSDGGKEPLFITERTIEYYD